MITAFMVTIKKRSVRIIVFERERIIVRPAGVPCPACSPPERPTLRHVGALFQITVFHCVRFFTTLRLRRGPPPL